ncbi:exported hypothetical protein [uncultured Stenotrophomonas sp.]|uniref:Transposase IS200-like domain-containing protein n=1 Tax=uncultured Stenotrophomonas sp. TaxID=165438 RepID=A0A1Y5Q1M6_9GAMM|nr:exported hypothetical protein [uncultured Stenotrophomonas sp.]
MATSAWRISARSRLEAGAVATCVAPTTAAPSVGATQVATLSYPTSRIFHLSTASNPRHPAGMPRKHAPGHAALRRGRASLPNQVYLVTFVTHHRQPVFADAKLAMIASPVIHDARSWGSATLLAWVLMPDHWHGLIRLGEGCDLSRVVQRLKAHMARMLPPEAARPVWARGFHDHALRQEEDMQAIARYIVMNPVRAGIVASPRFYPYWDAVWL